MLCIRELGGGTFRITFNGIPLRIYTIQYVTDLDNPSWQSLGTVQANSFVLFILNVPVFRTFFCDPG